MGASVPVARARCLWLISPIFPFWQCASDNEGLEVSVCMPKAGRKKYYAVRRGREGPKIYETWDECKLNISRYPGAIHKSFTARDKAEEWIMAGGAIMRIPQDNLSQLKSTDHSPRAEPRRPLAILPAQPTRALQVSHQAPQQLEPAAEITPAVPSDPTIKLSPEQQQVLNKVKAGESVFFTGSAGTGKSVLLREIIKFCRENSRQVAVTASTGIAAVNVGGSTVHSWAGIALGKEPKEQLAMKILGQDKWKRIKDKEKRREQGLPSDDEYDSDSSSQPRVVQRWRKVQTLIIDEISMIDGKLFDKLEYVARVLRRNQKPFGGIQLILSGDFCQLPPVPDKDKGAPVPSTFAFNAETWDACIGRPVCLKKVFRQKDQEFVDMLNAMRFGQLTPETVQTFKSLSRRVEYTDGIEPTELFSIRKEVNSANSNRLARLKTPPHVYKARDIPGWDDAGRPVGRAIADKLLERLVAQDVITLKEGAQVMLIKNLVQGHLVNGSIGKVTGFLTTRDAVQRCIKVGLAEVGQKPQPTGALSGKRIKPQGQPDANPIPEKVLKSTQLWPVVRFSQGSIHGGAVEVLCVPNQFEANNADGGVEATREQVPLILAWALSIHKSQGQTLERVRVDLGSVFEKGQAYVALSRATSMKTLEVRNFDPAKVMAHERVLEWTRANTSLSVPLPLRNDSDDEMGFWFD